MKAEANLKVGKLEKRGIKRDYSQRDRRPRARRTNSREGGVGKEKQGESVWVSKSMLICMIARCVKHVIGCPVKIHEFKKNGSPTAEERKSRSDVLSLRKGWF